MRPNLQDELRHDRRAASATYSASLMSNAKWRAVFSTLKTESLGLRQIIVRFIDVADPKPITLRSLRIDGAFADSFEFGPISLVGIEWIEIPAIALLPRNGNNPTEEYTQDIPAARLALIACGKQLPLVEAATGLRVVGHIR